MDPYEKQEQLFQDFETKLNETDALQQHKDGLLSLMDEVRYSHLIHPFTLQVIGDRVGVRWELPDATISVMFGPDYDWEYHLIHHMKMSEGNVFVKRIDYAGGPPLIHEGTPYYWLPEEILVILSVPEPFRVQYTPLLTPDEYQVEWETNNYDGMISGYIRYKNRLHYADCIEETPYEHVRVFAVYHLSTWHRMFAWFDHLKWYAAFGNKWLWKFHYWSVEKRNRMFGSPAQRYGDPVAYFVR